MLQGEIAGRTIPSCDGYPAVGHVMRDFQLCSSEGRSVQRSNMVLVFTGEPHFSTKLLSELEIHRPNLADKEARVLVMVSGSQPRAAELKRALHLNLEILMDLDGWVHRSMVAEDQSGHILPAVFVTDRFGEVFAAYTSAQDKKLPDIEEILSWIDFINLQCAECGPLE